MIKRARRKLSGPSSNTVRLADYTAAKQTYQQQVEQFQMYAAHASRPELGNFYWYHTVDVGNGIVTPGDFDYRDLLPAFHFPADMQGMKVLDIGSATGFFAFEFERRGAQVVSVELPSLLDWDIISSEKAAVVEALMAAHHARTPEEAYYRHLRGPFEFCSEQLGSKITRCYTSVYDLTREKLGQSSFDLVFMGDVLLHLFAPLRALDAIAPLCHGSLIITTKLVNTVENKPYLYFLGKESLDGDSRTWWAFNEACIRDMLERVGFKTVERVDSYSTVMRRVWVPFTRHVFHAHK